MLFIFEDIIGNNYEYIYKLGDWVSQNGYDGIFVLLVWNFDGVNLIFFGGF